MDQTHVSSLAKYQFISKIKQLPFVEKIILFGSRARGTHLSRSDIDLAIICPTAQKDQWQKIITIIDAADTLLSIDCVNFDMIDEALKQRILIDGIPL